MASDTVNDAELARVLEWAEGKAAQAHKVLDGFGGEVDVQIKLPISAVPHLRGLLALRADLAAARAETARLREYAGRLSDAQMTNGWSGLAKFEADLAAGHGRIAELEKRVLASDAVGNAAVRSDCANLDRIRALEAALRKVDGDLECCDMGGHQEIRVGRGRLSTMRKVIARALLDHEPSPVPCCTVVGVAPSGEHEYCGMPQGHVPPCRDPQP